MEAYVQNFQGKGVSVFSPILPPLPRWVGDIPTFVEWIRWFGNTPTEDIAHNLNDKGHIGDLGYVFMIIDVDMGALANLTELLSPHVQLVGYRELIELAHQKREHERRAVA